MKYTWLFAFAVFSMSAGFVAAADKEDPPAKKDLFAKEDWYKNQEGKEQEFVGVLKKVEQKGGIGFGRFNPYILQMDKSVREVYVGAKPELLAAYNGKKVKLIGKAVDMEVEGQQHKEIWAARLELVADDKKDKDEKKDDVKDLKIESRVVWQVPGGVNAKTVPGIARSEDELVKLTGNKEAATEYAKLFKVDAIDWKKQMVVIVSAGQKPSGGYSVEVTGLKVSDKTLTVKWKLNSPEPGAITNKIVTTPGQAVLADRFDGDVKFDPALPKGSGEEK